MKTSTVTGIKVVTVVDVSNAPNEPERHLEADVGLILLLKSEILLVLQVVPENFEAIE